MTKPRIDLVLPVHNEGASIAATLEEFYATATAQAPVDLRFVICEDGSKDNTVEVIQALAAKLPILLLTTKARKGYSRAVIDGFRSTTADIIAFIDSDGQCDPGDFHRFWETLADNDFVIGYRNPRSDPWIRILMSRSFGFVYRRLFDVRTKDPSCPYLLIRRPALERILQGNVGVLKQGFWWEFLARAKATGARLTEIPVRHRPRAAGTTQVYRVGAVPRIAVEHLRGLFTLKRELS